MDNQGQIVSVRIYNQTYSIRANDGNAGRTLQLAAMVNERMNEIGQEALTADSLKLAILAALHLADELDRANVRLEAMKNRIAEQSATCELMLDEILEDRK